MASKHKSAPWFVAEKRAAKADQIARVLEARGVTADEALAMSDTQREEIEEAARVRLPVSASTWRSVIEMLAGSAMPGALCRTCGIGDPEGVPGPRKPRNHEGPCSH